MNLLLDTNALLWIAENKNKSLGKEALRIIQKSDVVYFSSISIAELTIKSMLKKGKYPPRSTEALANSGLIELCFDSIHAQAIENFPSLVRHDPFDRMLLAQAYAEHLILLTADEILLGLGLNYVVDAKL